MNESWLSAARRLWISGGCCLAVMLAAPAWAQAGAESAPPALDPAQMQALQRAADAVVGVQVRAVENARSVRSLGRDREGSGIVIEREGLVLTIGYLILEAETLWVLPDDGRRLPARVVAYDLDTGFGLVQTLVPLNIDAAPLGHSADVQAHEPLVMASGGAGGVVSLTRLLSRRPFAGYWEYHIDGALFTSPPRPDHSGAGLFNSRGELVGVGSLFLGNAAPSGMPGMPGNMFVPVDLLRPILTELRARGSSAASTRAWLGVNCQEQDGRVSVLRVNEDSPAELAGLQRGDRILAIDGTVVDSLAVLWKTLWSNRQPERPVSLQIQRDGRDSTVVVHAVDRAKALRRPEGI